MNRKPTQKWPAWLAFFALFFTAAFAGIAPANAEYSQPCEVRTDGPYARVTYCPRAGAGEWGKLTVEYLGTDGQLMTVAFGDDSNWYDGPVYDLGEDGSVTVDADGRYPYWSLAPTAGADVATQQGYVAGMLRRLNTPPPAPSASEDNVGTVGIFAAGAEGERYTIARNGGPEEDLPGYTTVPCGETAMVYAYPPVGRAYPDGMNTVWGPYGAPCTEEATLLLVVPQKKIGIVKVYYGGGEVDANHLPKLTVTTSKGLRVAWRTHRYTGGPLTPGGDYLGFWTIKVVPTKPLVVKATTNVVVNYPNGKFLTRTLVLRVR